MKPIFKNPTYLAGIILAVYAGDTGKSSLINPIDTLHLISLKKIVTLNTSIDLHSKWSSNIIFNTFHQTRTRHPSNASNYHHRTARTTTTTTPKLTQIFLEKIYQKVLSFVVNIVVGGGAASGAGAMQHMLWHWKIGRLSFQWPKIVINIKAGRSATCHINTFF